MLFAAWFAKWMLSWLQNVLERFELLERLELYFAECGTRQSAQEPDRRTERISRGFCYECADYWRDGSQRRGDRQAIGKRGTTSCVDGQPKGFFADTGYQRSG